jgi:hypothetical protein
LNEIPANNHINSHYQLIFSLFLKPAKQGDKNLVHEHQKQSAYVKQRKLQSFFAVGFCFVFGGRRAWELGILEAIFKILGAKNGTIIQSIHVRHYLSLSYP